MSRARSSSGPALATAGVPPRPSRVALVLVTGVLLLLALREAAARLPGRALWGLDAGRDLPPAAWLTGVLLVGAACVPAVGQRLARVLPSGAATWFTGALTAFALAAFLWHTPDRSLFTGDTRLRQGSFVTVADARAFAPQALPGDLLLHHALPRAIAERTPIAPGDVGRAQGALLAVLVAAAALALARTAGATGMAAVAAAAMACGTASLALMTGYAKASVEVAALTTVVALGLARSARDARGLAPSGIALATALMLHRSALALVPAWLVTVVQHRRSGRRLTLASALGLVAPAVILGVLAADLWRTWATFDRVHHAMPLAQWFAPAHLADVANLLLLLTPALPLLPLLLALGPRPTRGEWAHMAALALPLLLLAVGVLPQQGLPRDWDVFALVGSAFAALLAWRAARVFAQRPEARSAAVALALVALVPALHWTLLQSDAPRLWARAESILTGPPPRAGEEVALGLATLGLMRYDMGERERARELFERAHRAAPHPRRLVEWGLVEQLSGEPRAALVHFERAAAMKPDLASAWRGVLEAAGALSDTTRVRRAADRLAELDPADSIVVEARAWLAERRQAGALAAR